MPALPSPFRAALGLAATVAEEARHLPDKAIELPMLAVSTALQMSLRAQQRYAALTARGDAVLAGRSTTDEAPPWATFDDAPVTQLRDFGAPVTVPDDDTDDTDGTEDTDGTDGAELDAQIDAAAGSKSTRPRPSRPRKTVRRPRTGSPSAFDTVEEDER